MKKKTKPKEPFTYDCTRITWKCARGLVCWEWKLSKVYAEEKSIKQTTKAVKQLRKAA
jgi:hypothetical protein